jgi:hypothetical protein
MAMKHTKVSVAIRKGAVIDDYEEFPQKFTLKPVLRASD